MLFADGAAGLVFVGLWLFCLIDAITADTYAVRNLPKPMWIVLVLILPFVGSVAWLVAGRPWGAGVGPSAHSRGYAAARPAAFPEYDRPGRAAATDPAEDERFLRQVRERAETQRREYEARRRAELDAEQQRLHRRPEDD